MNARSSTLVLTVIALVAVAACAPARRTPARPQSSQLGDLIVQAAASGRCTAALEMLDSLATHDLRHRDTVAENADVRACLPATAAVVTRRERYGRRIAKRDGVAAALFVVGSSAIVLWGHRSSRTSSVNAPSPPMITLYGGAVTVLAAASLYAFGGPIIHNNRGNVRSAGWSLLARLGLPAIGFVVADATSDQVTVVGVGIVTASIAAAMALDWFVLPVVNRPVTPVITPTPGGATAGLGWSF